jgi:hypothetical protein
MNLRYGAIRLFMLSALLCAVGCGAGGANSPSAPAVVITMQPANESVPMGLTGSFTVQASGSNLQFQWSRNGSAVPGATASTYTTGLVAFSDTGSTFTVAVSNASGSVMSQPATLTVTARAPKAGDLRFQQVDALSTINGYTFAQVNLPTTLFCPPPGGGGFGVGFGSATGTPFFLSNDECGFQFGVYALPSGVSGLEAGYAAYALQSYQNLLSTPLTPSGAAASDPGSVITSLYLDQAESGVGLGFVHSAVSTGFTGASYSVQASALQAAATQEGLHGRVLTAVSYDGVQATYFSYGWTNDPSTTYEAQVVFATIGTATAQIEALASQGYILTASGCTQAADGSGVVLVGTRVQGDTMPRPVMIGDLLTGTELAVFAQGYANVAVVKLLLNGAPVIVNYVGER